MNVLLCGGGPRAAGRGRKARGRAFCAAFLAVIMVLRLLPGLALAAETDPQPAGPDSGTLTEGDALQPEDDPVALEDDPAAPQSGPEPVSYLEGYGPQVYGGCVWYVTADGQLVIEPDEDQAGTENYGVLPACQNSSQDYYNARPWPKYNSAVVAVSVKPGVVATDCIALFYGLSKVTSMDLSGLDTSRVTDMKYMFCDCSSLTALDLSGLNTRNVTDMHDMFYCCVSLTTLDLSGWDTSSVTDMSVMFSSCSGLTTLDLSGWDTSSVTRMNGMFGYCSSLTALNLSGLDTSSVTDMGGMFYGCSSLTALELNGLDTSSVTHMGSMFLGCSSLTALNLGGWDTSTVKDMSYMFSYCSSLTALDLSNWDTSNVTYMSSMFSGCRSLTTLDLRHFSWNSVSYYPGGMFSNTYMVDLRLPEDSWSGGSGNKPYREAIYAGYWGITYHVDDADALGGLPQKVWAKGIYAVTPGSGPRAFLGWSTRTSSGESIVYQPGDDLPQGQSGAIIDLYPLWEGGSDVCCYVYEDGQWTLAGTCQATYKGGASGQIPYLMGDDLEEIYAPYGFTLTKENMRNCLAWQLGNTPGALEDMPDLGGLLNIALIDLPPYTLIYFPRGNASDAVGQTPEEALTSGAMDGNRFWSVTVRDDGNRFYSDEELALLRWHVLEGEDFTLTVEDDPDDWILWSCRDPQGQTVAAEQTRAADGNLTITIPSIRQAVEVVLSSTAPSYTVQYYASVPNLIQWGEGGDATAWALDTSRISPKLAATETAPRLPTNDWYSYQYYGRWIPDTNNYVDWVELYDSGQLTPEGKNAGQQTQLYGFAAESPLRELYRAQTVSFASHDTLSSINLLDSSGCQLTALWVLRSGRDPASTDPADWVIYTGGDFVLTNDAEKADERTILITDGAVLRLVGQAETAETGEAAQVSFGAAFYDYDISVGQDEDGVWHNNPDDIDQLPEENRRESINAPENYGENPYVKLAFGNANTGTGLADETFYDDDTGYSVNFNQIYPVNGAGKPNWVTGWSGGCAFGLVTGLDDENNLVYREGVFAPNLFGEGEAKGKTAYPNSQVTFIRQGDTYTLSSAQVRDSEGNVLSSVEGLEYLNHPSPNQSTVYTDIWTNNFWPLDGVEGTDPHFGGTRVHKQSGAALEYFPDSDDGLDHNCYFGMSFSVDFTLTGDYTGPLEYLFFGDDDLWVFLDDQLICDLGGIHSAYGEYVDLWQYLDSDDEEDLGEHTLRFFYTERGASGSTCYMSFTLPSVSGAPDTDTEPGSLTVSKEVEGEAPAGAFYSFQIDLPGREDRLFGYVTSDGGKGLISSGQTLQLQAGQSATIQDIPAGAPYTVTETGADGYITTVNGQTGQTLSGSIAAGTAARADFVNTAIPTDPEDLSLTKILTGRGGQTFHGGYVEPGDELTYTVTVTNSSGVTMEGAAVTDTLPEGLRFLSAAPEGYSQTDGTVGWTVDLAPGASRSFTITAAVEDSTYGQRLVNTARAVWKTLAAEDEVSVDVPPAVVPVIPPAPVPDDPQDTEDDGKPGEAEGKPQLNRKDHVAYIIGYPYDYFTGEPTDDQTRKPVRPEGNITRAEVVTIFFRLLTDESRAYFWDQENPYSDVPFEAWHNNAISTLTNAGIVEGYPDGTFRPNAPITRAEFATIAVRFSEVLYNGGNTFTDVPDSHWAARYIALAQHLGWVNGYPDGSFRPDRYITRAESMTLVNRVLERAVEEEHLLPDMLKWPDNLPGTWYYAEVQEATNSHLYERLSKLVPDQSFCFEDWWEIEVVPDWEALEKEWSEANSVSASVTGESGLPGWLRT